MKHRNNQHKFNNDYLINIRHKIIIEEIKPLILNISSGTRLRLSWNIWTSPILQYLHFTKGYGALVLSIPDGRSKPLFAPYDFKPSPGVPKFLPRPKNISGHLVGWFEIICIIHMAQIAVPKSTRMQWSPGQKNHILKISCI